MFCMAHSSGFTGLMGHELFHRRFWLHKLVGTISMCKFFYGHFVMEHCAGHHINVGTLEDPATARRGESYYKFLFRSSLSGIKDAFNREVERAERWGHSGYGLYNKVIFLTACQTFWILLMIYFFGQRMILLHLIYILLPIALLEGANYVEHYGIERKKINKNYYESINHLHSWNTPHKVTNYLSFRLQRHSDHHVHSYRPYQTLRSYEVSPQLPFGYET
mmetsp:Transcript_17817/g.17533  ORF Transcript_17817/g.17533 Transcript_17817/m.17533 type:complete len:220 (+) Transcript_17817:302-961(+)